MSNYLRAIGMASVFLLGIGLTPNAGADPAGRGFLDCIYKSGDVESKYVVFIPPSYKGDKPFPVVLFLHGSGSTGTDGKKQVSGIAAAIRRDADNFPAIVVFPQSQKRSWRADSEDGKRALEILAEVEKQYKVDSKRIYLTGLSMGGFGTWSLAVAHPEKWAAIVPICGGGDPRQAEKIKNIPCWCFHGDADPTVKVDLSRNMIKALKAAGGDPKYTEYPGVEHNSWTKAYGDKELYEWLWKQTAK